MQFTGNLNQPVSSMTRVSRAILILCFCIFGQFAKSQIIDNFNDGDFTNNPTWIGIVDSFTVSNGQLRSTVGNASNLNFYLSTASTENFNSWEFFFRLNFNPSPNNFAEFWLTTDNLNIEQAQNGFFVRLGGNTPDGIGLFKKQGGIESEIISQSNSLVNGSSNNQGKIKVTRTAAGNWEILEQITTANFIPFGTGTDNSNLTTAGAGVWIKSTKSNRGKHYFDDIKIENTSAVDLIPPTLISASLFSPNQVELLFSEPVDEIFGSTSSFFSISPSIPIVSSSRLASDFSKVRLSFGNNLAPGSYSITVNQAKDLAGNIQIVPQTKGFFISAGLGKRALVINEIYADETPSLGLPLVEYIEILNTTSSPIQLEGDSIQIGNSKLVLPNFLLAPNTPLILCKTDSASKFSGFGQVLGIALPILTNTAASISIKDNAGTEIDAVTYALSWYNSTTKQNGGWSLEQINPNLKCSGKFNWSASNAGIGGTPGTQNSIFSNVADAQAPVLDSLVVVGTNQIRLVFNEILNTEILTISNFSIPGLVIGSVLTNQPNNRSITLNLTSAIQTGTQYTLSYSGVKDCEGNVNPGNQTKSFIYLPPAPIPSRALVINEIYADENPSFGLPKVEYLEILNTQNQAIQLKGASLILGADQLPFPEYILPPNGYLIVCKTDSASKFSSFGPAIGLLPSTVLTNTGKRLSIEDISGNEVDVVNYQISWYRNTSKQNGGYSLEQINPNLKCSGKFNWSASDAGIGGTPGAQNSIFSFSPDLEPPALDSILIINNYKIRLVFSEFIGSNENPISNFSIPGLPISEVITRIPNERSIEISLLNPIQIGIFYTLSWTGVRDCEGNSSSIISTRKFINLPAKPLLPRNLVINEIYADETPTLGLPIEEYIEIYNTTKEPIQLKGSNLSVNGSLVIFPEFVLDSNSYAVVCDIDSVDSFKRFGNVVGISSLNLTNSGSELKILDIEENEIDVVDYSLSWYGNTSKQEGGYSLEQINPSQPCSGKNNWLASVAGIGGTPGAQNSIKSNQQDTEAPQLIKVEIAGENKLLLIFSEPLNALAPDVNSFKIPGLVISSIGNRNPDQTSITVNFTTPFEIGRKYELTLNQIKDCAGNPITEKILSVGKGKKPGKFDLLITEVQADDTPDNLLPKAEYVEIYNNSASLIDLSGVKLVDEGSIGQLPNSFIGPGEYLVLTGENSVSKFEGISGINVLGVSTFPTLNSEGDKLTLFNGSGGWIHQFHFNSSEYSPFSKWSDGWSLELIDLNNPCGELNNWAISTSSSGGTPGKENSVKGAKPDLNSPKVVLATVPQPNIIKIKWDELLDSTTLSNVSISISNNLIVEEREISPEDFSVLNLKVKSEIPANQPFTITIGLIKDCAGNGTFTETIETVRTGKADSNSWLLNEILFDPKTGGSDYVEIKNISTQYLDLKEISIANDTEIEPASPETIPIKPGGFALFTASKALTLRDYPKGKVENFYEMGLPSFNSDSGTIRLLGPGKAEWQKYFYSEKNHAKILDETKGVSLERISAQLPVNNPDSWQSASSDADYGTPGYENSQTANVIEPGSDFSVEPRTISPNGDGNKDFAVFSYNFETSGLLGNLRIYSAEGLLTKTLAQTALLGKDGFWKWDGTTEQGRRASIGLYVAVLETVELGGKSKYFKIPVAIAPEN